MAKYKCLRRTYLNKVGIVQPGTIREFSTHPDPPKGEKGPDGKPLGGESVWVPLEKWQAEQKAAQVVTETPDGDEGKKASSKSGGKSE